MCVLETIWEIIEWNRKKKNKCIINGIIQWKIPKRSNKTFQISTYLIRNNENCFSEA